MKALSQFTATMTHQDRAIEIDVDKSSSLEIIIVKPVWTLTWTNVAMSLAEVTR